MVRIPGLAGRLILLRILSGIIAGWFVASSATAQPRPVARTEATVCTGEISGTVGNLVVPVGAECTSMSLFVAGHVSVERDATLRISGSGECLMPDSGTFITQKGIDVARGGTLSVGVTTVEIGGDIVALGARGVGVVKIPCEGARGVVRGHIIVDGADAIGIMGLQIRDSVFVTGSGDEGLEVGANTIGGTLFVKDNKIVGAESPSIFAVHLNTVGRGTFIIGNDATMAIVPPLVGANTITHGSLVCLRNVPAPTNQDFDVVLPNIVLKGVKLGQCAGL